MYFILFFLNLISFTKLWKMLSLLIIMAVQDSCLNNDGRKQRLRYGYIEIATTHFQKKKKEKKMNIHEMYKIVNRSSLAFEVDLYVMEFDIFPLRIRNCSYLIYTMKNSLKIWVKNVRWHRKSKNWKKKHNLEKQKYNNIL